jgi:hypothetical protein
MSTNPHRAESAEDFEDVYTRGFFKKILAMLTGQTRDFYLLSYDEVSKKMHCHDESYSGIHSVPISAIVGSVGRYKDFDRAFLPLRRTSKERWRRIDQAFYEGVPLPAIQLYRVGDSYFIKDGNHRVSVARERGVVYIDAEVIETVCKSPVPAHIDADDLQDANEQAYFLEWSQLDQLRPDHTIRATIAGAYHDLEEHINVHQYYMSQQQKLEVALWDAVAGWYDSVYMPIVRLIREENMLEQFPRRTETDLYLWIMDRLNDLRQRYGSAVAPDDAVEDFMRRHEKASFLGAVRQRIFGAA